MTLVSYSLHSLNINSARPIRPGIQAGKKLGRDAGWLWDGSRMAVCGGWGWERLVLHTELPSSDAIRQGWKFASGLARRRKTQQP